MRPITREQRAAIYRLYQRSADNAPDYRTFRRRAVIGYDCVMVQWCGMWCGIEKDGYTHT